MPTSSAKKPEERKRRRKIKAPKTPSRRTEQIIVELYMASDQRLLPHLSTLEALVTRLATLKSSLSSEHTQQSTPETRPSSIVQAPYVKFLLGGNTTYQRIEETLRVTPDIVSEHLSVNPSRRLEYFKRTQYIEDRNSLSSPQDHLALLVRHYGCCLLARDYQRYEKVMIAN